MNPVDAIRLMVRHHPGGWDAMGVLCGKSGETLRHAFSKDSRFVPSVIDCMTISQACIEAGTEHCRAFVNVVALESGGFVALPVREPSLESLQVGLARVVKEASDILTVGTARLADGRVSENDAKAINKEITELLEQVQQLQQAVEAANQMNRPRAVA